MNEFLRQILFLPEQRSTVALDVDRLHYFVILVTMTGATLVTLIGGYFLLRYRRRTRDLTKGHPVTTSSALTLEVLALFALGFMFLGWWSIGTRQFVRMRTAPEDSLDIYVTGKQWMWKFAYPQGQNMISALYVPAGRPIKLIMTSRDVIHSFFVPEFRIKQDVLPGRYTTVWFEATRPGAYPILCTEYCGTSHSDMRGQVIALSPADFERWLSGGPAVTPEFAREAAARTERGFEEPEPTMPMRGQRAAAENGCLRCHTLDGTAFIGPTWAGLYLSVVPLSDGGEVVADEAYLTESIMDPLARLHRGFDPVMPSYQGLITPPDIAAMVELIKSLRDVPRDPVEPAIPGVDGGVPPAKGGLR